MDPITLRREVLARFGATGRVAEELLAYNDNVFAHPPPQKYPLDDEPFVADWRRYAEEARGTGVFPVLKEKLVQLRFPVREGMSSTAAYQAVTRQGANPRGIPEATGLILRSPDSLELIFHPTPAGHLPVIVVRERSDFVALVQALVRRNEPEPIPDTMGACLISGYRNWDRLKRHRDGREPSGEGGELPKELYLDRFAIVTDGPYSKVGAAEMGLPEHEWRMLSLAIRLEHESVHYFTRRVLGAMRTRLLDELIADFVAIIVAAGEYRAEWFLRFLGLERYPDCRPDGRIHQYRGTLSDGAFAILQGLVVEAARRLEKWNRRFPGGKLSHEEKARLILTLSRFTLEELADDEGFRRLADETKTDG